MLPFFRGIRRSLLESSQTRKYLAYAVGEILLVMMGILLALQVNNWNQNRMDSQRELILVQTLYQELNSNLAYIDSKMNQVNEKWQNSLKLLDFFVPATGEISVDSFMVLWLDATQMGRFRPKVASLYRVVSNEEFNWIRNDSLKVLLNDYKLATDNAAHNFELVTDYSWNMDERPLLNIVSYTDISRIAGNYEHLTKAKQVKSSQIFTFSSTRAFTDPGLESNLAWYVTRWTLLEHNLRLLKNPMVKAIDLIEHNYDVK